MAEQKAKPATKKVTSVKTSSTASSKPKITKATAAPKAKIVTKTKKVATKKTSVLVAKPKNTKAPAAKKSPAPAAAKKVAVKKTAATKEKPVARKTVVKPTPEERYRMIQTAAYFMAEHNGFSGNSTEHWAAAEAEIARKLGE